MPYAWIDIILIFGYSDTLDQVAQEKVFTISKTYSKIRTYDTIYSLIK